MNNNDTNNLNKLLLNEKSSFKTYCYYLLLFNGISIFFMIFWFCILFYYKAGPYHELYRYQVNKLNKNHQNFNTVFLGDSSLGNALNAELFNSLSGLKSANLALTGLYGFAGTYNMLKKSVKLNNIKNVIIVHALDMMSKPVAYNGYFYSLDSLSDIIELKINETICLLETSINEIFSINSIKRIMLYYILQKNKRDTIEKDYIKQMTKKKFSDNISNLTINTNHDKLLFLKKIVNYCNNNKINLLYLHGPHLNNINSKSIKDIRITNMLIESTGIKLIDNICFLKQEQVGDNIDHVLPYYKEMSTHFYYKNIKDYLVY